VDRTSTISNDLHFGHFIWLSVLRNASVPFYDVIWFSQPDGNMDIF